MKNLYLTLISFFLPFCYCLAQVEEYALLSSFTKISNETGFDVFLEKGDEESVRVAFIQNVTKEDIHTEVVGNTLEIRFARKNLKNAKAKIFITYQYLEAVSNFNEGNVIALSDIDNKFFEVKNAGKGSIKLFLNADQVSVKLEGEGHIDIHGKVLNQLVSITGSGAYRAYQLTSAHSDVEIFGPGKAEISVERSLLATVEGAGNIYYKGNPTVEEQSRESFPNIQQAE